MPSGIQRPTSRRKLAVMINQLLSVLGSISNTAAKTFHVNSTTTGAVDSANAGSTAAKPFATIGYAISQCVADRGDTILVGPGHAETVNAAAFIACATAGVSIIGTGAGSKRPTLTWATATDATITMTAANCRWSNFVFDLSLPSALISGIVISAAGCRIDNCLFLIGTAGTGTRPLQAILTTAAANYLRIEDNQFLEPTATPTTVSAASCAIKLVGGTGIKIRRNQIHGWFTTTVGGITSITTLNDHIEISDNVIINQTASSAKAIALLTGSTGMISNNRLGILTGTAPIGADAAYWEGNYYAAAVATAGTLV